MDRPPRFAQTSVMVPGLLLHLVLSIFFGFFFYFADLVKSGLLEDGPSSPRQIAAAGGLADSARQASLDMTVVALAAALVAASLYHTPLRRYFHDIRKGRTASISHASRDRIFRSPLVIALAFPAFLLPFEAAALAASPGRLGDPLLLPVEASLLALSSLFTYLWQRHRVQALYLPWLYTTDELSTALARRHRSPMRRDFLLLVSLCTLLPTLVVALFIGTGVSLAGTVSSLGAERLSVLFNAELSQGITLTELGRILNVADPSALPLYFIAPLDTLRVVAGLALGLAIILVYVWFIARWTAGDIIEPVLRLKANMARAKEGDLAALTPAVTANELGELTQGFNEMLRGIADRQRIKALFGQYLTPEVSEAILEGRVRLEGDRYLATVMFADIRGFTSMSERLEPEEVFSFLNQYLGRMIEVIAARGGIIDKFLGDGILAVFGLPVRSESHAADAFAAAMDMRVALETLNAERWSEGLEEIKVGIGMHTGPVIAGNVGSERKLQFTVIGDTVNLASRIEGLNKDYGSFLLMSGATRERLGEVAGARFERIEGARIRGKSAPVELHRLLD